MDNKYDAFGNQPYSAGEILAMQKKDEEPMRLAVEKVLLPSLEDSAAIFGRVLAAKCGAYNLFAATEAVSIFLLRYITITQNSPFSVLMHRNGDVLDCGNGKAVITAEELAVEVARFTELWETDEVAASKQQPAVEAIAIVLWLWLAMKYQPCLLQDFVATATDNPDCFLLTEQPSSIRGEDARQRWSRKK